MKHEIKAKQGLFVSASVLCAALFLPVPASATGLAKCDSGPKEGWQPQTKLESDLTTRGWKVRRIKVDGGC